MMRGTPTPPCPAGGSTRVGNKRGERSTACFLQIWTRHFHACIAIIVPTGTKSRTRAMRESEGPMWTLTPIGTALWLSLVVVGVAMLA